MRGMTKIAPILNDFYYVKPLVKNGYVKTDKIYLHNGSYKVSCVNNIISITFKKSEYIIITDRSLSEKCYPSEINITDYIPELPFPDLEIYVILTPGKTIRSFKLNEILNGQ